MRSSDIDGRISTKRRMKVGMKIGLTMAKIHSLLDYNLSDGVEISREVSLCSKEMGILTNQKNYKSTSNTNRHVPTDILQPSRVLQTPTFQSRLGHGQQIGRALASNGIRVIKSYHCRPYSNKNLNSPFQLSHSTNRFFRHPQTQGIPST